MLKPPHLGSASRRFAVALIAAALALATLGTLSPWETSVGPGRMELSADVSANGVSIVDLPPLGDVRAATHDSPLSLQARLTRLDAGEVRQLISEGDPARALSNSIEADLSSVVTRFVVRVALIALGLGVVVGLLFVRRDRWALLIGPLSSVLAVAAPLTLAWRTYDVGAFEQPLFTGSLAEAPRVLGSIRERVENFDETQAQLGSISTQIAGLYATTATGTGPASNDVRILHVSDLHSNPLAMATVRRLADTFDVAAIVDTGDVTAFGSPLESSITDLLAGMPAPYLVVPGNHDSQEIRAALGGVAGVQVLDRRSVDIQGVRIFGFPDPSYTADNQTSQNESDAAQRDNADDLARAIAGDPEVDVVAVHNPLLAAQTPLSVPLIIAGHGHRQRVEVDEDGRYTLLVGSTGAGGVAETGKGERRYEAQVLYFREGRLTGLDYISVNEGQADFSVDRRTVPLEPTGR